MHIQDHPGRHEGCAADCHACWLYLPTKSRTKSLFVLKGRDCCCYQCASHDLGSGSGFLDTFVSQMLPTFGAFPMILTCFGILFFSGGAARAFSPLRSSMKAGLPKLPPKVTCRWAPWDPGAVTGELDLGQS